VEGAPVSGKFELLEQTAEKVRTKQISPVELVEESLRKIEDSNPKLNAFVQVAGERALEDAKAMADRIAKGEDPGPLAGLPLGVKDLQHAKGFRTSFGSRLHLDDPAQGEDDWEVALLRKAGAIVVGKTNTPEYGWSGYTAPPAFGPARNPWNPELTPGGSSGGSAVAVATRMVALATASDGGGSIRIPAAFTGLFGLKPNLGRVGHNLPDGWQFLAVHGPLTRTVRDAALLLDLTAGPAPGDPFSLPPTGLSYRQEVEKPLGRIKAYVCLNLGWGPIEPEIENTVRAAVDRLGEIGVDVEEIPKVLSEDPANYWIAMSTADNAFEQGKAIDEKAELYDPLFHMSLLVGRSVTRETYQLALRKRYQCAREVDEVVGDDSLLLCVTTATPPFKAEGPHPEQVAGQPVPPTGFIRTYPFNFTGHPAASIPCGKTSDGLPVGLQVVGPRFREDLILRFAAAFEEAWPWDLPDT
jgi:Asp-tRNA(Asn)/Glu-tRNA(Gln) amidotransferase A subunit family amidase